MKIPLSLSVYEHAAQFLGRSPWTVSRDQDLLVAAHSAAYETYQHTPLIVGIDIYNLEAEAYGCEVEQPDGNGIPAVTVHPCASVSDVSRLTPFDAHTAGRLPMVIEAGRALQVRFPEADVRIPVSGPFSLATSLVGLNTLLLEAAMEPEATAEALHWLVHGQVAFAEAVVAAGLDVAFFESAAAPPLLSPDQFRHIELPALKQALQSVAQVVGHALPCIIGGNTCPIIPAILETGTNFLICPAETDREAFVQAMLPHPEVAVRVNLSAEVYARGTNDAIAREIDAVLRLAKKRPNILLGTGAIPYETPVEAIQFIRQYVA